MDIMVDYYKILDVPQSASMNDIKRAYRSKVLRWHPDKNPDNRKEAEQKFKEIVEAYKVLSDRTTRDHYDGSSTDTFKETKKTEAEKHLSVFDQDGIKIFFTGQRSSSDFSVSFFSAPKRFHHFSIMTAFINGKKITTKRHLENESKYLEVEEDGKTVSIHVNGIPVFDREINGPSGNDWDYRLDRGYYCPEKYRFWTCERRRWADDWRRWASKWRDWAEECRDWAEGKPHQKDKSSSGAYAGHRRANAAQGPKASEEHLRSDKGCPSPEGKFSMPGEGKCDLKEGHYKTNKGQTQPEEEHSKPDKGYFVFPKPGEKNSGPDEGHPKANKKQQRPEEGHALSDKYSPGFARLGEGHTDQDEGHVRRKKEQPRPEEGQSRLDKGSPGHKKTDPACNEFPMKHKAASEHNSQAAGNRGPHKKQKQEAEGSKPRVVKSKKPLGKNEWKDEKLDPKGENGGSTSESEVGEGTKFGGMQKKSCPDAKLTPKPRLSCCGAKGMPLKRREPQIRIRKPYGKRSKSQAGRSMSSYGSRSKFQAGNNRMPDGQSKCELDGNDLANGGREVAPKGKQTPLDCKGAPPSRKKGSFPALQEGDISFLPKKRLLRRRAHRLPPETRGEKHQYISETSQLLDINGQRRGRLMKPSLLNAHLPSIQGQKLGVNQLPNVTR
ncbi:uncharacterized protein LOC133378184 [Rhineura floridana]|uniref:uncharacterized protein LOC133378184 n=1 Tax=Rhineura floridana TaxID=261503 RepID=UPI002AC7FAD3|nr:uncharacterized protein LOC133378184 [Rhineura floridana]